MPTPAPDFDALDGIDPPLRSEAVSQTAYREDAEAWMVAFPIAGAQVKALGDSAYDNANEAALSAVSAAASEVEAAASAEDATDQVALAAAQVALAAGYAATSAGGAATNATSSTSWTLATGSKAFVLNETGKAIAVGMTMNVTRTSDATKRGIGLVTAVANLAAGPSPTVTIDIQLLNGAGGPYTDWTLSPSAPITASIASQAEAEAGTDNAKAMTPLRTAQAIAALAPNEWAILQDQKASGVGGSNGGNGTWGTRDLNTEVYDPDGLVTISSNQATINVPGDYEIEAHVCVSPNGDGQYARARLYDVSGAAVLGYSEVARFGTDGGGNAVSQILPIVAPITVTTTKTIRVEVYSNNTTGTIAAASIASVVEVYLTLIIRKKAGA